MIQKGDIIIMLLSQGPTVLSIVSGEFLDRFQLLYNLVMRKLLFVISFLFFVGNAGAHSPQVSTISFIQNENKSWSVFITAPLYACQLAIQANYPAIDADSLDIVSLQQLMISLIKEKLIINGGNKLNPVSAKIQVAHETTVYFEIKDSILINEVDYKVFSKLRDHFTLLKIVPLGAGANSYVLNSDNRYVYKVQDRLMLGGFFNLNKYLDIVYRIGSRYILIAGIAFLIFYAVFIRKILFKKV